VEGADDEGWDKKEGDGGEGRGEEDEPQRSVAEGAWLHIVKIGGGHSAL
jgi:hypothetical protein